MVIPLSHIKPGETVRIVALGNEGPIAGRLLDMGFEINSIISCVLQKSRKNIAAYLVRNAVIALRECDSRYILVTFVDETSADTAPATSFEVTP